MAENITALIKKLSPFLEEDSEVFRELAVFFGEGAKIQTDIGDLSRFLGRRRLYRVIRFTGKSYKDCVYQLVDDHPESIVESDRDLPIDLNTQPYTLYILMVYMSLFGDGLDWNDYPARSEIRKEILKKYNAVYEVIGKGNSNSDYRDKAHVSRIRKSLRSYEKTVTNINLFIPEKIVSGSDLHFRVPLSPDLVYVIEGSKGKEKEVRMVDSEFWKL